MRNQLKRLYWALVHRFHPNHQYNILKTGLPPGYYDLDTRILYAVMNNFREFYDEGQHTYFCRNINWDTHPEILNADEYTKEYFKVNRPLKDEWDKIYDWWVHRYLKIIKDHVDYWKNDNNSGLSNSSIYDAMFQLEEKLEEEANDMLARLMKTRLSLWD